VFAIAICSRRVGAVVLCVWAAIVATGFVWNPLTGNAALSVAASPFCIEFFLGIVAAVILSRLTVPFSGIVLAIGLIGFATAGLCEVAGYYSGFGAVARLAYGVCAFLVILALVERERSNHLKVPSFMAVLGRASYAVYLVHLIAIGITFKLLSFAIPLAPSSSFLVWALLCTMGLAGGIFTSIWLEQPLIRFVRKCLTGMRS
jgi:exopolysaccharide production protein ExoZ